jgi:NADH-quinone oxidoreductase subunit L
MEANLYLWMIPALPLLGAAWNGLAGRKRSERSVAVVAIGSVALSFFMAMRASLLLGTAPVLKPHVPWVAAAGFRADFNFYFDPLAAVMTLVVTGVGLLIHIYAAGYMAREGGYYRFFAYLNLFVFFMLVLVLAGNYLLLFAGWEGVGLCSYLLIGFYFRDNAAADAGRKAFLVNRIGDFGFLIALLLLYRTFHSLDFAEVFPAVRQFPIETGAFGPLTWICLLMLVGATGKSAQVPLYVWLPDAMLGPTPVSALIHAATMVTAGVYVIARSGVLYLHAPEALLAVAVIGAVTALYAATIAITQTDIKRVLAYSTISQIGYMIMSCGVAAFSAGIFHLMTHAFFKALLFLGAGSVIHALGGEQDLRNMGGLRRRLPWTYLTFLVACLAIAAIPPFAGFWSKDQILWETYASPSGGLGFWLLGVLTAGLTSFYMFRLLFLTFGGKRRTTASPSHAPPTGHSSPSDVHVSPSIMKWPLVVLAILSLVGGWVGVPALWGGGEQFQRFLAPSFQIALQEQPTRLEHSAGLEIALTLISLGVSLAGIGLAYLMYVHRPELASVAAERLGGLHRLVKNKYYVDEVYRTLVVRPLVFASTWVLWRGVDQWAIDGAVNYAARETRAWGRIARQFQAGNVRSYAAWVALGAILLIGFMMAVSA